MSRFVTDLLILVAVVLAVRIVAEGNVDASGLLASAANLEAPRLPFEVDWPSFALGAVGGAALGYLLNVRWAEWAHRSRAWFAANSARFSYIGLSLGFAIVLLYY